MRACFYLFRVHACARACVRVCMGGGGRVSERVTWRKLSLNDTNGSLCGDIVAGNMYKVILQVVSKVNKPLSPNRRCNSKDQNKNISPGVFSNVYTRQNMDICILSAPR